ncbi:hypothetical protein Tco_1404953 [Tanacetum coccineum]
MSTSKTYQQSLADAGSETRPPMLERGSYIPWASRFKRFLNRKRENRKWLLKALEDGPYVFRNITPTGSTIPRLQEVEDLQGDDLLYYDAEMELMNMILLSIPNEIYNSVDSCKTAKEMWARVERLMRGTIQNQVDRETRFTNEFDQFVAEPGESLVSVYNRFAQLMNDLERNNMKFPTVSVNTKFLNSLQPEWLKYVTQVRLAKQLTVDSFDDLFDYLSQFEKFVNASRERIDYDLKVYGWDDVHNHSEDPLASAMLNQAVVQGDRVNIQSRNSGNCSQAWVRDSKYFMEQMLLAKKDEAGVILSDEQNDFLFAEFKDEEIKNLCKNMLNGQKFIQLMKILMNGICEAAKQQRFAQKVQQQNMTLTSQIEMYKERNRVLENITKDNNYLKEFLEADERVKRVQKQAESQLYRDRDIIRDLEKHRDKLSQEVKHFKT